MQLEKVVPFGRSLDEYRSMFALTDVDLGRRVLGVGDGPASFNAEMTNCGHTVVSVDPLYLFSVAEIERRFHAVKEQILEQVAATPGDWVWSFHVSAEGLRTHREQVMQKFAADYEEGRRAGRYITGELPRLPFADTSFRLALCSHLLFLYSEQLDYDFHRASVLEMLRVADEVRIFPLLTLTNHSSPHLPQILHDLRAAGYVATVEQVEYELQRGGNQMLRIRRD